MNPDVHWVGQVVLVSVSCYLCRIRALEACVVVLLPILNSVASWLVVTAALTFSETDIIT